MREPCLSPSGLGSTSNKMASCDSQTKSLWGRGVFPGWTRGCCWDEMAAYLSLRCPAVVKPYPIWAHATLTLWGFLELVSCLFRMCSAGEPEPLIKVYWVELAACASLQVSETLKKIDWVELAANVAYLSV